MVRLTSMQSDGLCAMLQRLPDSTSRLERQGLRLPAHVMTPGLGTEGLALTRPRSRREAAPELLTGQAGSGGFVAPASSARRRAERAGVLSPWQSRARRSRSSLSHPSFDIRSKPWAGAPAREWQQEMTLHLRLVARFALSADCTTRCRRRPSLATRATERRRGRPAPAQHASAGK